MITISQEEYVQHVINYDGLCLSCLEFTSGGVEPDAEGYECENCGEHKVMGTENALLCNHIEIYD